VPFTNYNTFHSAFLTTFQVLTMESWPLLLYDGLRAPGVSRPISALYYISWVFLGNFMLLNLFLAILLDSFTDESTYKEAEAAYDHKAHVQRVRNLEGAQLIEYYLDLDQ
jgi:Ion transport protein